MMETFFAISFQTLNLFSFVLGGMWGASYTRWRPHKIWLVITGYFAAVALFWYVKNHI